MPKKTNPRRQTQQKHPDEWRRDLSPDRMAGQKPGGMTEEHERITHTAYDVKAVHRALEGFNDDELKQIPILDSGTRLRQGGTYLDLERGEFTATGEMSVGPDQKVVPKEGVTCDRQCPHATHRDGHAVSDHWCSTWRTQVCRARHDDGCRRAATPRRVCGQWDANCPLRVRDQSIRCAGIPA
jgi:hypothetical protein